MPASIRSNERLNSRDVAETSGTVTNRSRSTCQENARCCIGPYSFDLTTTQCSGESRIMPTIDESGTILTIRSATAQYRSPATTSAGNPGPSSE